MQRNNMEQRLATLEGEVARLKLQVERLAQPKDWRSAMGMFTGDEYMKEILEEGRKIREADRRRTMPRSTRHRRKAKV